jgi:histidinol dehydrogenase
MNNELDGILILSSEADFHAKFERLHLATMRQAVIKADETRGRVREIIINVGQGGDEALVEFTKRYDGVELKPEELRISKQELRKAHKKIDSKLLGSIRKAIKNVRKYQSGIFIGKKKYAGLKYTPIKRVGICVPVIMNAVPAQVAGVKEIAIVSPPRHKGSIHPVILATCYELKIDEVYRVGGAQAVAALTLGTKMIPKVNKIVGPGNQWVQTAKQDVFGFVGIDSVAGPSEVLIIANDKAIADWAAADMLSQAEHCPGSAILFTNSKKLAEKVLAELKKQIGELGRSEETVKCLKEYSGIVVFRSMAEVISRANDFAAEHLEIQCGKDNRKIADKIENAGAIFIGDYSPVAVGDYWAGPSHTLPTGMSAKFFSALSANDFIKGTSIIEYDKKKLAKDAEDIIRLAECEGLDAHARSIKIRTQQHKT